MKNTTLHHQRAGEPRSPLGILGDVFFNFSALLRKFIERKPKGVIQQLPLMITLIFTALALISCTTFSGPASLSVGTQPSVIVEDLAVEPEVASEDTDVGEKTAPPFATRGRRDLESPTGDLRFDWPVDRARLSRGFIPNGRGHWGLDLANTRGTPILAAEDGVVVYTGRGFKGYGNLVVIEHNEEWATLYSHLHKITAKEGQVVKRGQKIGTMGRTGRATGVHLHFEIRQNRIPINPLALLPDIPNTVAHAE